MQECCVGRQTAKVNSPLNFKLQRRFSRTPAQEKATATGKRFAGSRRSLFLWALITAAMFVGGAVSLHAQTPTAWSATVNGTWGTGANWTGGSAPANSLTTNYASFNLATGVTVTTSSTQSVAGIDFGSSAGAYTLSLTSGGAKTLTLGAYGVRTASANDQIITGSSLRLTLGAATSFQVNGTGDLTISASNNSIATTATNTLTLSGSNTGVGTLTTVVSGTGGTVTKSGTGTWILGGANTFTGALSVQGGTLAIATINNASANGTLGNSANAVSLGNTGSITGTLQYTGSTASSTKTFTMASGGTGAFQVDSAGTNLTLSGVIDGSGALAKTGAGTLTLSGANTYGGATTISAGTLKLGAAGVIPDGSGKGDVSVAGTLDLNTFSETINGLSGAGIVDTVAGGTPTLTVGGNDATSSFSGTIKNTLGTLALTKTGIGTLTLASANTFSGATTVSAGTLKTTAANALGSTASVTVSTGGILELGTSNTVNNSAGVTLSGGTILRDAGVSETFGNLNLTTASTINFGTGAIGTLTFGTYTPTSLLTVSNFAQGDVLVFGSNLTSSINNGSLFSFSNGFTSSWNGSTFTITAVPEPSAIFAGVLMLGVLAWPHRRRVCALYRTMRGTVAS